MYICIYIYIYHCFVCTNIMCVENGKGIQVVERAGSISTRLSEVIFVLHVSRYDRFRFQCAVIYPAVIYPAGIYPAIMYPAITYPAKIYAAELYPAVLYPAVIYPAAAYPAGS